MKTQEAWRGFSDAESLARVKVRLCESDEREKWDKTIDEIHYLDSRLVGPSLRYVAELDGQWVGVLSFGQAAYHLRDRDEWIGWSDVQRGRRLPLVAQNTRFALLHDPGAVMPRLAGSGLVKPAGSSAAARTSTRNTTDPRNCGANGLIGEDSAV